MVAGCAAERHHREGLSLIEAGRVEEGLSSLERAVREAPTNAQYRASLLASREAAVKRLLIEAANAQRNGQWDSAEAAYARTQKLDPDNDRVVEGRKTLARDRRHAQLVEQAKAEYKAGRAQKAAALLQPVQAENSANPQAMDLLRQIEEQQVKQRFAQLTIKTQSNKPISLRFSEANLKMVFEALARSSGVNFILDKDVRPDIRATVYLNQVLLEDAVDLLLQTNKLEKKVVSSNTVMIYPNTPDKAKDYQELMVKGFYLANADVKQTQAMLKGLLKAKDIFIDEKLNLLVMRDTPEAIRLAEKLIAMHDLYEPEVMLEVEVLEVKRSKLMELGVKWPDQVTLAPLASSGTTLTLADLKNLNSSRVSASVTPLTLNLRKEITDANLLANPRIRARNREKAKILIGDKVPVVTTTTTATGFASENVQYLDVGLKLEVEPNVYLQDEVAIKVGLEVSSIVQQIRTAAGGLTYQIGTRNANTVLRLRDGETQVLAGLISDDDRTTASRVPGLGDLPVLGRLFSSQRDDHQKTEIVLSITPRLIRNIARPDAVVGEFWSGTESLLKTKPLTLTPTVASLSGAEPGADAGAGSAPADLADAKTVTLSWQAPAEVKVGEEIKAQVRVKADGALRALFFQAVIDPEAFDIVDIDEGAFFKQASGKTSFSSNHDPASGRLFVGVARSGEQGVAGEETIAVITLKAKRAKPQAELKITSSAPVAPSSSPQAMLPAARIIVVTP